MLNQHLSVMIFRIIVCLFGSYISAGWADGGFGIETTRVIYHQDDKAVMVTMRNTTKGSTYLVQTRIEDAKGKPVQGAEVIPPLVRIDAESRASVRILIHPLIPFPPDRESLIYFHAKAISSSNPLAKKEGGGFVGRVSLAIANRIKLLYRPEGMGDPSQKTFEQLIFSRVPGGIRVKNPTSYNVTLNSIKVDGHDVNLTQGGELKSVISPFSEQVYLVKSPEKRNVQWSVINDLGTGVSYTAIIQ